VETTMLVALIGLLGGLAVGLQAPLASLIGQRVGPIESIFIVHLGGTIAAGLPLLLMRGGSLGAWRNIPWYAWPAGLFGLVVIGAITYTIPKIGVATTIFLVVVGQLLIGMVLDHFGLLGAAVRPINLSRIAGIVALLAGTWLMLR